MINSLIRKEKYYERHFGGGVNMDCILDDIIELIFSDGIIIMWLYKRKPSFFLRDAC